MEGVPVHRVHCTWQPFQTPVSVNRLTLPPPLARWFCTYCPNESFHLKIDVHLLKKYVLLVSKLILIKFTIVCQCFDRWFTRQDCIDVAAIALQRTREHIVVAVLWVIGHIGEIKKRGAWRNCPMEHGWIFDSCPCRQHSCVRTAKRDYWRVSSICKSL